MKTFYNNNNSKVSVKRSETELILEPIQQMRGTKGVYPGLSVYTPVLVNWIGGQEEWEKWILQSFNSECQLQWKDACEALNLTKESNPSDKVKAELVEKFTSYLVQSFDGRRSKERSASDISVEIIQASRSFTKLVESGKAEPAKIAELKQVLLDLKAEHKVAREREDELLVATLNAVK